MKIQQFVFESLDQGWPEPVSRPNRLVLVFGSVAWLDTAGLSDQLKQSFPEAIVIGCSTAGEVSSSGISDESLVVTVLDFDATRLHAARVSVDRMEDSERAGEELGRALSDPEVKYVMVIADGVAINGGGLVDGMDSALGGRIPITGGLAGDAGAFERTLILDSDGTWERAAVGVSFAGAIQIGHGSIGGWEPFGPVRRITRCADNVLNELDGRPALEIYEAYLGEDAKNLPGSGLLYPLAIVGDDPGSADDPGLIRTLLGVDRDAGSLILAGNVPQGGWVRLMHANFHELVDGAGKAAFEALSIMQQESPEFALLVSCVGRRLLMGTNTDLEIDAVREALGDGIPFAGFYSNGEISPLQSSSRCELHNQTMTVTILREAA